MISKNIQIMLYIILYSQLIYYIQIIFQYYGTKLNSLFPFFSFSS